MSNGAGKIQQSKLYLHNVWFVEVIVETEDCEARGRLKQYQYLSSILGQAGICEEITCLDHSLVQISSITPGRQLWIGEAHSLSRSLAAGRKQSGRVLRVSGIESKSKIASLPWRGCASTTAEVGWD
jgi:hypothetical protein